MTRVLHVREFGRVAYGDADRLQHALHRRSADDYLLLLEHPPVYTLGRRTDLAHVLTPPASVGADLVRADRGGDVTYHGPGQLVGYPVMTLPEWRDGRADVVAYVRRLEAALLAALAALGVAAHTEDGLTGVWIGEGLGASKIVAIGVNVSGRRTRHGFALNVDPDLSMFEHIVPCGIANRGVTSLARVLGAAPEADAVLGAVVDAFRSEFGYEELERQGVTPPSDASAGAARLAKLHDPDAVTVTPVRLLGRLAAAGVTESVDRTARRPSWMRVTADLGPRFRSMRRLVSELDLHTVCREAGCPNVYECWNDGTATFMILGERCTRACGFCLVDTRHPLPVDPEEPERVAEAVARLGLAHAVVTSPARDDLGDGGAHTFAATIQAVRNRNPATAIEVLIPDCKGDVDALDAIFDARPDVLNHNLETVARLARAVRPSAGYVRSLALLARAKDAGLVTKSGLIVGMGETRDEVVGALGDLRGVGVDIVTIGQYLQPTEVHLPVARWWTPEDFDDLRRAGETLGFAHVEAGPLVRSSYHARQGVNAATGHVGEGRSRGPLAGTVA